MVDDEPREDYLYGRWVSMEFGVSDGSRAGKSCVNPLLRHERLLTDQKDAALHVRSHILVLVCPTDLPGGRVEEHDADDTIQRRDGVAFMSHP